MRETGQGASRSGKSIWSQHWSDLLKEGVKEERLVGRVSDRHAVLRKFSKANRKSKRFSPKPHHLREGWRAAFSFPAVSRGCCPGRPLKDWISELSPLCRGSERDFLTARPSFTPDFPLLIVFYLFFFKVWLGFWLFGFPTSNHLLISQATVGIASASCFNPEHFQAILSMYFCLLSYEKTETGTVKQQQNNNQHSKIHRLYLYCNERYYDHWQI